MVKTQKYIKPSSSDIDNLKYAQSIKEKIDKNYKDKRQTEIMFYASIFLFCFGFLFWSNAEVFSFISGIGLFGLVLSGFGMHSHRKGDAAYHNKYFWEEKQKYLKEVECKYTEKNDKFYVYLEDGRKIEVDEY